jgi:hypothetical protein
LDVSRINPSSQELDVQKLLEPMTAVLEAVLGGSSGHT